MLRYYTDKNKLWTDIHTACHSVSATTANFAYIILNCIVSYCIVSYCSVLYNIVTIYEMDVVWVIVRRRTFVRTPRVKTSPVSWYIAIKLNFIILVYEHFLLIKLIKISSSSYHILSHHIFSSFSKIHTKLVSIIIMWCGDLNSNNSLKKYISISSSFMLRSSSWSSSSPAWRNELILIYATTLQTNRQWTTIYYKGTYHRCWCWCCCWWWCWYCYWWWYII